MCKVLDLPQYCMQLATLEAAISFLMQHLPPELTPPPSSHQDTSGKANMNTGSMSFKSRKPQW